MRVIKNNYKYLYCAYKLALFRKIEVCKFEYKKVLKSVINCNNYDNSKLYAYYCMYILLLKCTGDCT